MAALVAAIHVFDGTKSWMRGTSPRMTIQPILISL
jgi:hypothetical protein